MISQDEFSATLHAANGHWQARRAEIASLVDRRPLLLAGFGGKGRTMAEQLRHLAGREVYVHDASPDRRALAQALGFPVVDRLPPQDGGPWTTVLAACQAQAEQRALVPGNALYFQEAATFFGLPHLAHLASDFQDAVIDHMPALYDLYGALHPVSRPRLLAVLRFRASLDPTVLAPARAPVDMMWVDVPRAWRARPYHTVMDIGAFDGDTLRTFGEQFASTRGIAVEANASLFDAIRTVAARYPRGIDIQPVAAWSRTTRLVFEEVRNGMIRVSESPDGALPAARMDEHVHEPVDFLKMDIEGAEADALDGCAGLLARCQPDLALAAYHRPQDLVALWTQGVRLGCTADAFDWHVGHYSDCLDDTILYAMRRTPPAP